MTILNALRRIVTAGVTIAVLLSGTAAATAASLNPPALPAPQAATGDIVPVASGDAQRARAEAQRREAEARRQAELQRQTEANARRQADAQRQTEAQRQARRQADAQRPAARVGQPPPPARQFDKAGVRTTDHFRERLAQRQGRGITEQSALDAYRNGRLYYDPQTRNYVRHSSRTGVSVVTDKPSSGRAITVFEGNPSPRWNPVRGRPGQ